MAMGPRWLWPLLLAQPQCPWEAVGVLCQQGTRCPALLPCDSSWGAHRDPLTGFFCQQGHSGHCGDIPRCPTLPSPAGHHLRMICLLCHISSAPSAPKSAKFPSWSRVDRAGPSSFPAPQPDLGGAHPSLPRALSLLSGAGSLGHHPGGSQSAPESCWLPTAPEGHCPLGMATGLVGFAFCKRGKEGGFRRGGGEQAPLWAVRNSSCQACPTQVIFQKCP